MQLVLLPLAILIAMPSVVQEKPAEPAGETRTICRRILPTGSNVSKKVCDTEANWKRLKKATSKDKDSFRDRPNAPPVPFGTPSG